MGAWLWLEWTGWLDVVLSVFHFVLGTGGRFTLFEEDCDVRAGFLACLCGVSTELGRGVALFQSGRSSGCCTTSSALRDVKGTEDVPVGHSEHKIDMSSVQHRDQSSQMAPNYSWTSALAPISSR